MIADDWPRTAFGDVHAPRAARYIARIARRNPFIDWVDDWGDGPRPALAGVRINQGITADGRSRAGAAGAGIRVDDSVGCAVISHNRRIAMISHDGRITVIADDSPLTPARTIDCGRRRLRSAMITNHRGTAVIANDWPATARPWVINGGRV